MTNPDNIVRVRARNGGRASVYEANGWGQAFSSGILEGNGVIQNTVADMNVLVGGSQTKPDVLLAENPSGYRVALDVVGQQAIAITAPATNSRISAIVAYTDDLSLATTEDTVTGSPASCGLIVVNGATSNSPTEPTDAQIRTAITADGATGSQAAYCIVATILVASDTTTITNSLITLNRATISSTNVNINTSATTAATSTDANGWTKIALSSNINMYLKRGTSSATVGGGAWKASVVSDKPVDLVITNEYFGGAGAFCGDHAMNACGWVHTAGTVTPAKVELQYQNLYGSSVTSSIYWWAYIVEIL